ncbi:MAG: toprim domain-containing protein, partial [Candidatus Sifarchaeia archaeon]
MLVYTIKGVDVIEEKPVSEGNESLCTCPNCGRQKLYVNRNPQSDHYLQYECKVCPEIRGKAILAGREAPKPDITPKKKTFADETIHRYVSLLLDSCEINEYVRSYFFEHGIPIELAERFNVGYNYETPDYRDKNLATTIGLLNKKGNSRFYNRIVFPVKIKDLFVNATSRAVGDKVDAKWLDMSLPKRIYNDDIIDTNEKIYMFEGAPDTLKMISHGYENSIGILGSGVFKTAYSDRLKNKTVVMGYDNDESGIDGTKRISNILSACGCKLFTISLPEDQDICSYFKTNPNAEIKVVPIKEIKKGDKVLIFKRAETNLFLYKYSHYELRVKDIIPRKGALKATVSISNETRL